MNNKDIAEIRKQFKLDNDLLKIVVEEESTPTLDTKEIERVLKASGVKDVNTEKAERAFQQVVEDKTYEMKASHIVPSYASKSIKISTKV